LYQHWSYYDGLRALGGQTPLRDMHAPHALNMVYAAIRQWQSREDAEVFDAWMTTDQAGALRFIRENEEAERERRRRVAASLGAR
jgi:hypothetical protein